MSRGLPIGSDWSIDLNKRRATKGGRLKLHMREDPQTTYCGRRMDCIIERQANGVEIWNNGGHVVATTDRPEDVRCRKCLGWNMQVPG